MANTMDSVNGCQEQVAERILQGRGLTAFFLDPYVLAPETFFFICANILDFLTTYFLLTWPGSMAFEANPIARIFLLGGIKYLAAFKCATVVMVVVCCEIVARSNTRKGKLLLRNLTLVVAGVVIYSLILLCGQISTASPF